MNIVSAMKASNDKEFQPAVRALSPILTDKTVSVEEKRKCINKIVSQLSDKTFNKSYIQDVIISWINVKKEISELYADTKSQVDFILTWLPRMAEHRDKIEKYVKTYRKQLGLKL